VEVNSTEGQGSHRAVVPSDDDDCKPMTYEPLLFSHVKYLPDDGS
jgi:hypothetical protein